MSKANYEVFLIHPGAEFHLNGYERDSNHHSNWGTVIRKNKGVFDSIYSFVSIPFHEPEESGKPPKHYIVMQYSQSNGKAEKSKLVSIIDNPAEDTGEALARERAEKLARMYAQKRAAKYGVETQEILPI